MFTLKDSKQTSSFAKRKLVLVDFRGPELNVVRAFLSEAYPIVDVASEDEALCFADKHHDSISAILFNLEHGKRNGYSILAKFDEDKRFVGIPNIAVTASVNSDEYLECLKAGASEYIEPPFKKELVLLRINNAIRSKDSTKFSEMEQMLRELPSNIYLKDIHGKYVFATHYWHHIHMENDPSWTIRGKTDIEIRTDTENAKKAMESDLELLRTGKGVNYIIEEKGENGPEYLELIKRPTHDENGNVSGIVALINDVTEMQLLKMELEKRSRTDSLTGLLNKQATEELVSKIIHDAPQSTSGALLMIDVDKFKHINDSYGHIAGDRVLTAIGHTIRDSFKGMDVIGRIGGDEFMVYLRDIHKSDTAICLAVNISDKVRHLFPDEDFGKYVSISVGIAMFPEHSSNFEGLFRAADLALYDVKANGRNSCKVFVPSMISQKR